MAFNPQGTPGKGRRNMKLLNKGSSIFDRTIGVLAFFTGILLIIMILSVTFEIIMRYFLGQAPIWVIEISEYILLWITFLAAAWVLKQEGHVKMDFAVMRLSSRSQYLITSITSMIGVIVFFIIAWYGVRVTWEHYQIGYFIAKPLRTPSSAVIWVIPLGSFLFSLQFLKRAYSHFRNWRETPT